MVYSGFTRIVLIKYPSFCMHVVGLLISYFQKASFEKLFLSEVFRRVFLIRSSEAAFEYPTNPRKVIIAKYSLLVNSRNILEEASLKSMTFFKVSRMEVLESWEN